MGQQPPGDDPAHDPATAPVVARWVCRCQEPPILLGTYGSDGRVHIKVRDRYWHVTGRVEAVCPRCGTPHLLVGNLANEREATRRGVPASPAKPQDGRSS